MENGVSTICPKLLKRNEKEIACFQFGFSPGYHPISQSPIHNS
jgi:hypothetical protein